MSNRLCISFSGGATSAYMAKRLTDIARQSQYAPEVVTLFANTGEEDERTLQFVDQCDRAFGLNVVWVEAVVDPRKGKGTTFRRVDFATASRNGEPFEAVIAKYGIPNRNYPHCTRETKERPITAYLRSIGWAAGTYDLAIGIRADERDRKNPKARDLRIIYPLIQWGIRKDNIKTFWADQSFRLGLSEEEGNCRVCWKKSRRKLLTIAARAPERFEWARRMEQTYPMAGPGAEGKPRRFYRDGQTSDEIIRDAQQPFEPFSDQVEFQSAMDLGGGCGESCEVFSDLWDAHGRWEELSRGAA